ncbi:hypothetical protein Tco_0044766 [Tanacetum coccineum]
MNFFCLQFAAEIVAGTLLICDVAATCVGSTRGATQGNKYSEEPLLQYCEASRVVWRARLVGKRVLSVAALKSRMVSCYAYGAAIYLSAKRIASK